MKKILILLLPVMVASLWFSAYGQAFVANVENVYGGRVNAIAVCSISGTDSMRIFITTESANSAFWATAKINAGAAAAVGSFTSIGGMDAAGGYGSNIQTISAHSSSGYMFFIYNNQVYKASHATGAPIVFRSFGADTSVVDIQVKDDRLWYFFHVTSSPNNDRISYSELDASAVQTDFVAAASYNTNGTGYNSKDKMHIGEYSDSVLLFEEGTDPSLTIVANASDDYPTKSLIHDDLSSLSSSIFWNTAAIAPNGAVFIGGSDNNHKYIAYRDTTSATWTVINTGISGTYGKNIAFYASSSSNYYVYFGSAYSNSKGVAASWNNFGNTSLETHSNDGAIVTLGTASTGGVVLMTTDQGIGWTRNSGSVITEIDDGIEAVQVNDFDMNAAKTHGWLASKAGVRLVSNYNSSSVSWSNAMFPNGDGSPYYSAEMIGDNTSQAYVGNVRVYKTTNGGSSWSQVFTAESAPYNFPSNAEVQAIEVNKSNTNIVMAGYSINGGSGGCFYSLDGGSSWSQLLISAGSVGQDIDVHDIVFTSESGKIVAYIGVEYTVSVNGVYRAEFDGISTWTLSHNSTLANSGDGISMPVNVQDIDVSITGDILAFVGPHGFNGTANAYFKVISADNKWYKINVNSSLLPLTDVQTVAIGEDTLFVGENHYIGYSLITTGTMTLLDYATLPTGTRSYNLYYDALLCGGSTGFYSFRAGGGTSLASQTITFPAIPNKMYNQSDFSAGATASSGLAVSYASSNTAVATIVGSNIHIVGVGSTTITASQAGNASYAAATPVSRTLTVTKATQAINFPAINTRRYTDPDFNPGAASTSLLAITYQSSKTSVAVVEGNVVKIVGVGTATITASQTGNANYSAAQPVSRTLVVEKGEQVISFPPIPQKTYGDPSFLPGATSSAGYTVKYSTSNRNIIAFSNSGRAVIKGTGTVTITAFHNGGSNYEAAVPVDQTIIVDKANQAITFPAMGNKVVGTAFKVTATAPGGRISFVSSNPGIAEIRPGNVIWCKRIGVVSITAKQSGNNYYNPATATQILTIVPVPGKPSSEAITGNISLMQVEGDDMKLYPNPVKTVVNLSFRAKAAGSTQVAVYDVSGRLVSLGKWCINIGINRQSISVAGLKPGSYYIVLTANGQTHKLAFVKQE